MLDLNYLYYTITMRSGTMKLSLTIKYFGNLPRTNFSGFIFSRHSPITPRRSLGRVEIRNGDTNVDSRPLVGCYGLGVEDVSSLDYFLRLLHGTIIMMLQVKAYS